MGCTYATSLRRYENPNLIGQLKLSYVELAWKAFYCSAQRHGQLYSYQDFGGQNKWMLHTVASCRDHKTNEEVYDEIPLLSNTVSKRWPQFAGQ